MPEPAVKIRWAPRVRPDKIRRLYRNDADGILDEDLLDEVGYGLYARCESIVRVSEAAAGRVHCPGCGGIIMPPALHAATLLHCPGCAWELTWGEYHRTWQHRELYGGGAVDAFQDFMAGWARARTPQAKMLLIDRLIHVWHWENRSDHQLGRPAGVNLIEGSRKQVLAFLAAPKAGKPPA